MNVYGLHKLDGNYPTAASLAQPNPKGVWMQRQGFNRVSGRTGAVMVLQPWVGGAYGAGHIGIVAAIRQEADRYGHLTWVITMRSANWSGGNSTVAGCNNVGVATVRVTVGNPGLSFWYR